MLVSKVGIHTMVLRIETGKQSDLGMLWLFSSFSIQLVFEI